jgi:nuclear transport factor 2 (NTF2) superfamily protein
MKEPWCFTGNRISLRFEFEWHDANGQWFRTQGISIGSSTTMGYCAAGT